MWKSTLVDSTEESNANASGEGPGAAFVILQVKIGLYGRPIGVLGEYR